MNWGAQGLNFPTKSATQLLSILGPVATVISQGMGVSAAFPGWIPPFGNGMFQVFSTPGVTSFVAPDAVNGVPVTSLRARVVGGGGAGGAGWGTWSLTPINGGNASFGGTLLVGGGGGGGGNGYGTAGIGGVGSSTLLYAMIASGGAGGSCLSGHPITTCGGGGGGAGSQLGPGGVGGSASNGIFTGGGGSPLSSGSGGGASVAEFFLAQKPAWGGNDAFGNIASAPGANAAALPAGLTPRFPFESFPGGGGAAGALGTPNGGNGNIWSGGGGAGWGAVSGSVYGNGGNGGVASGGGGGGSPDATAGGYGGSGGIGGGGGGCSPDYSASSSWVGGGGGGGGFAMGIFQCSPGQSFAVVVPAAVGSGGPGIVIVEW